MSTINRDAQLSTVANLAYSINDQSFKYAA
jgi:hypothetical protein